MEVLEIVKSARLPLPYERFKRVLVVLLWCFLKSVRGSSVTVTCRRLFIDLCDSVGVRVCDHGQGYPWRIPPAVAYFAYEVLKEVCRELGLEYECG